MKTLLWLARSYFSWYCFRKTARGALQDFLIFFNIHLGVVWWTSSIYPFTTRVVGNWYSSEHSDKAPRNLGQQIQWAFFSEITNLSISIGIDLIQNIEATIFNAEGQEVEADPKISSGVLQSNTKPFWGFSTDRNRRFVCVPISGGGSMALFGDLNGYYKDIYSRLILSISFF